MMCEHLSYVYIYPNYVSHVHSRSHMRKEEIVVDIESFVEG
jgi:hypothetical protein